MLSWTCAHNLAGRDAALPSSKIASQESQISREKSILQSFLVLKHQTGAFDATSLAAIIKALILDSSTAAQSLGERKHLRRIKVKLANRSQLTKPAKGISDTVIE